MNFWFEFLGICMNEKVTTCHDCHDFKWQNINIYPIWLFFFVVQHPFWLVELWLHPCIGYMESIYEKILIYFVHNQALGVYFEPYKASSTYKPN